MNSKLPSETRRPLRRLTREEAEGILLRAGLPSPLLSRRSRRPVSGRDLGPAGFSTNSEGDGCGPVTEAEARFRQLEEQQPLWDCRAA